MEFKSEAYTKDSSVWLGPEYWSNPLQDWQWKDGWMECVVSKPNRNVHLLTLKMDSLSEKINMSVQFKILASDSLFTSDNWIGFSLGSRGNFNDYRDDAVFGKGLNAGLALDGSLFIDEEKGEFQFNSNQFDPSIIYILDIEVDNIENGKKLKLTLNDEKSGEVIHSIEKVVDIDKLTGDLVLVSHFNLKNKDLGSKQKSVSFKDWRIKGQKLRYYPEYEFGPILFSQYTLSKGVLTLTAQLAPVKFEEQQLNLEILENGKWTFLAKEKVDPESRTATFRLSNWPDHRDIAYRLTWPWKDGKYKYWEGLIRKDPIDKDQIKVAGFTGNSDLGFPNTDIFDQIKYHDPDLLFFSGDQIYESVGGYGIEIDPIERATLDYLRKWYLYGWAYRDLMKDRPVISIPDDHDVYHGNIWGAGGKAADMSLGFGAKSQDSGGYKMPPQWVNMVQRTQCSHLPIAYDPEPVMQGIETYFTDLVYGGISFAIIEDRKFKSPPAVLLPEAQIQNGWVMNKDFNIIEQGDIVGATLLGERQLSFLDHWVSDWSHGAKMKVLLSQTIFANVATLPLEAMTGAIIPKLRILNEGEYPPNDRPVADLDSNGWPQSKRNKVLRILRKGFVFHLAGDQHLGSTIQYGVDEFDDAGYALCVPSISNYWPRRWYPSVSGKDPLKGQPPYTGKYLDGFGNKMTVHAVSNPTFTGKKPARLYDRAAGYGLLVLDKTQREIGIECWPRHADFSNNKQQQYKGWPIKIEQMDNYGREAKAYLPDLEIRNLLYPVVEVINESSGELAYSLRLESNRSFKPKVFDENASYTIRVGDPDKNLWQSKSGVLPGEGSLMFSFNR